MTGTGGDGKFHKSRVISSLVNDLLVSKYGWSYLELWDNYFHTLKQFIIQQMHKYIFHRYNWNYYKIFKIAPTCFGSQGIYHQRAL